MINSQLNKIHYDYDEGFKLDNGDYQEVSDSIDFSIDQLLATEARLIGMKNAFNNSLADITTINNKIGAVDTSIFKTSVNCLNGGNCNIQEKIDAALNQTIRVGKLVAQAENYDERLFDVLLDYDPDGENFGDDLKFLDDEFLLENLNLDKFDAGKPLEVDTTFTDQYGNTYSSYSDYVIHCYERLMQNDNDLVFGSYQSRIVATGYRDGTVCRYTSEIKSQYSSTSDVTGKFKGDGIDLNNSEVGSASYGTELSLSSTVFKYEFVFWNQVDKWEYFDNGVLTRVDESNSTVGHFSFDFGINASTYESGYLTGYVFPLETTIPGSIPDIKAIFHGKFDAHVAVEFTGLEYLVSEKAYDEFGNQTDKVEFDVKMLYGKVEGGIKIDFKSLIRVAKNGVPIEPVSEESEQVGLYLKGELDLLVAKLSMEKSMLESFKFTASTEIKLGVEFDLAKILQGDFPEVGLTIKPNIGFDYVGPKTTGDIKRDMDILRFMNRYGAYAEDIIIVDGDTTYTYKPNGDVIAKTVVNGIEVNVYDLADGSKNICFRFPDGHCQRRVYNPEHELILNTAYSFGPPGYIIDYDENDNPVNTFNFSFIGNGQVSVTANGSETSQNVPFDFLVNHTMPYVYSPPPANDNIADFETEDGIIFEYNGGLYLIQENDAGEKNITVVREPDDSVESISYSGNLK